MFTARYSHDNSEDKFFRKETVLVEAFLCLITNSKFFFMFRDILFAESHRATA